MVAVFASGLFMTAVCASPRRPGYIFPRVEGGALVDVLPSLRCRLLRLAVEPSAGFPAAWLLIAS